jgi:hypothetical protein
VNPVPVKLIVPEALDKVPFTKTLPDAFKIPEFNV